MKAARTVLRGARRSNAPGLPGEVFEPLLLLRQAEPRIDGCRAGCRDVPLRSGRRGLVIVASPGEHRRPRDIEGTHPGRCSCVRNVETPSGSGSSLWGVGRWADREESRIPGWAKDDREANAGSGNAAGNRDKMVFPSRRSPRITGRIPGLVPGRESGLTRSGEPVKRKTTMTPEPDGSTRSFGGGPTTTVAWSPARRSPRWMTTCGG